MDQNRCLLDVIDNPQLLQSFLESESSAETTNNIHAHNNNDNTRATNNIQQTTNVTAADSGLQGAIAPNRIYSSTADTVTITTSLGNSNSGFTDHASDHDQGHIGKEASYNTDNAPVNSSSEKVEEVSTSIDTHFRFRGADGGDETNSFFDPVVSVLDSIITETVAETSPSSTHQDANGMVVTEPNEKGNHVLGQSGAGNLAVSYSTSEVAPSSISPSRAAIGSSSPALDSTLTYHNVGTGNIADLNDANNNSTSSSDNGSNDLLVDEFYSQRMHQPAGHDQQESTHFQQTEQAPLERPESPKNPPAPEDTVPTAFKLEQNVTEKTPIDSQPQPVKEEHNHNFQHQQQIQDTQYQSQPQVQPSFALHTQHSTQPSVETPCDQIIKPQTETSTLQLTESPAQQPSFAQTQQQQSHQLAPQTAQQQLHPQSSNADSNASPSSATGTKPVENQKATKGTSKNNASKTTPENKPKRAPRPKKNAKTNATATAPTQTTTPTNTPIKPMPTQFITTSQGQQQMIFQNSNGMRQPTMLAPTSMAQTMGGMPQTQRVIQIQTPNGPMYFAIAPGPAANANNSNISMSQQQQQQPQQQQLPGMQSQQYPSQQICFQPGANVMLNRPQMNQTMSPQRQQMSPHQQQQQMMQQRPQQMQMQQSHLQQQNQQMGGNVVVSGHQMMQPSHQQRLGSPVVAIANQQGPNQQQHVMMPSSQQMMMPRMPNQIIMNRPIGGTGQVMSGQQQFIQIMTPNGPMLLALPQQQQQQQQAVNNTMIDYNSQLQSSQMSGQMQPQQQQIVQKGTDIPDGKPNSKQSGTCSSKNAANSKSGLDLGDLLLDCGILPDDRAASQSSSSIKSSQSPSLSQISSPMPPNLPQTNSPMPSIENTSFSTNHPQPTQQPMAGYGQYQGQPIRITMGPDGQMIMQPAVYGAIRPVMAGSMAQSPQLSTMSPNNIISPSNSIMTMTPSNPSTPKPATTDSSADNSKKTNAKGKGTAVKRSRSKKSDIDKFPQLKTPKIAQQQQQQQQQQSQAVVVPMTFLVGDQSKVLAGSPDVKPNITQLGSGQQVSIAKFVSPGIQSTSIQSPMSSNMMQTGMNQHTNQLATSQMQVVDSGQMNTQLMTNSGNSINISSMQQQQNATQGMIIASNAQHSTATSQMSSSDNLKIEPNGLKATTTGQTTTTQNFKGQIIVLHSAQAQQRHNITIQKQAQLQQQQQLARQKELRAQAILNQLNADQNAALNPQTRQSFQSLEDACKRLLRYHVFDTESVGEEKISEVDDIFEAAVESLLSRKQAIYDKYRLLILKQSMKTVPLSEKVMMEQVFVNDELTYLKKERELFREYEAHLDRMASQQSRDDTKSEYGGPDYFSFGGTNSPKQDNHHQVDEDSASRSRDVDDWLLPNKWADSRYSSVPDSEAATAIESILNEEIS